MTPFTVSSFNLPIVGSSLPLRRTYTSGTSVTETAPTGAVNVAIIIWGGGEGGLNGYEDPPPEPGPQPGNGGDGGGACKTSVAITAGQTLIFTVGAAGASNGGDGGTTTCSSGTKTITTMTANGGTTSGGAASGGTVSNTTGNSNVPGELEGGVALSVDGLSFGGGGNGGFGTGGGFAGDAGETGAVTFYYT